MLVPVQRLIDEKDDVLMVTLQTPVREALRLMVDHDYSQLPVIDSAGRLTGLISEESISRNYLNFGNGVDLLELAAEHCQSRACTLPVDRDLFDALDLLKSAYAVVVVDDRRPVGIITNYDSAHFFRDLAEALMLIRDVELTLRKYIEAAFPAAQSRTAALLHAFGADRRHPTSPAREYDQLSFGEHLQMIVTDDNWPRLKGALEPKDYFTQLIGQVRDVRNTILHFRGELTTAHLDLLKRASFWLEHRPEIPGSALDGPKVTKMTQVDTERPPAKGKYGPLLDWLIAATEHEDAVSVMFSDIEEVIADDLPPSARSHRTWWANDSVGHVQSESWLGAGWKVADVDFNDEVVTFVLNPPEEA